MIQFQTEIVTVFQSALYQTTSTVVRTNDLILIVDPTWLPNEVKEIQAYVQEIRDDLPLYLLFTHGDFDHIIAYKAFPDAKVIGSKGLAKHPEKEKKVEMILSFDQQNYIRREYPAEFPVIDIVAENDGQQHTVGSTTLHFYLAPGHSQDGLLTIVEPMGIWIAGDYLSDFELPFIYDSTKAYLDTLGKFRKLLEKYEVNLLIPGHGHATAIKEDAETRIEMAERYIHTLIEATANNDNEELNNLENQMAFPSSFTKECHQKNIEITRKELAAGIVASK
ncbi:MBL fold metallo-hydrolase [Metabacillus sp. RGM 3146]|uniref:MBL fold metallo-hydrolase n=1 Tax=Metabacillus sp. RGM 3146 TaxID=3401092 RepID=UPI003B9D6807